jgi:hypothetical protein
MVFLNYSFPIYPFFLYSCLATFATYEKAMDCVKALNEKVGAANGLLVAKENIEMRYHQAWVAGTLKNK